MANSFLLLEDGVNYLLLEDGVSKLILETGLTSTTTVLSSSLNPSFYLQSVTFTAVVSGAGGTPTGTVQFFDFGSLIGSGSLDVTGTATFATPALTIGAHNITAVYGGDSIFAGSTSNLVVQTVNIPGSPTILLGQIVT
jgi:Bacterial Ig-like domain (group 3)